MIWSTLNEGMGPRRFRQRPLTLAGSLALALLLCALFSSAAHADATCSASTSGIAFGPYDVFAPADHHAVGSINVSCTGLAVGSVVGYQIQISAGAGSFASRTMTNAADRLNYNLYTNSSRSIVWGDGSAGTSVVSDNFGLGQTSINNNYPVYGSIPAGQNVHAGDYFDVVIVTVEYQ